MNTRTWVLVALLAAGAVSGRPSEDDSSRTRRAQNGGYQFSPGWNHYYPALPLADEGLYRFQHPTPTAYTNLYTIINGQLVEPRTLSNSYLYQAPLISHPFHSSGAMGSPNVGAGKTAKSFLHEDPLRSEARDITSNMNLPPDATQRITSFIQKATQFNPNFYGSSFESLPFTVKARSDAHGIANSKPSERVENQQASHLNPVFRSFTPGQNSIQVNVNKATSSQKPDGPKYPFNHPPVLYQEEEKKPEVIPALPTTLILKPQAKAVAGCNGTAIATPVSHAVYRKGQPVDIHFDPRAVAIAGPGGRAQAHSDLLVTYIDDEETPSST